MENNAAKPTKRRTKRRIYKLDNFNLIGISMANASEGESVPVMTRNAFLSDDPWFHHVMRGIAEQVDDRLHGQGVPAFLSQASNFAIVVDPDFSAKLYFDCVGLTLEMLTKRGVEKGEAVRLNDIGDIRSGRVDFPRIKPGQRFVICLRHEWKYLLIFDLTPEGQPDIASLEATIGIGMRRLMFEKLYQAMADEVAFTAMVGRGWFPFNALMATEFSTLLQAVTADFNQEGVEAGIVASFGEDRLAPMLDIWWRNPQFEARREMLSEGVKLFSEQRYMSAIKTMIFEIEGILRDRHVARTPGKQGIVKVLDVAFEDLVKFADAETLYFPDRFVKYPTPRSLRILTRSSPRPRQTATRLVTARRPAAPIPRSLPCKPFSPSIRSISTTWCRTKLRCERKNRGRSTASGRSSFNLHLSRSSPINTDRVLGENPRALLWPNARYEAMFSRCSQPITQAKPLQKRAAASTASL